MRLFQELSGCFHAAIDKIRTSLTARSEEYELKHPSDKMTAALYPMGYRFNKVYLITFTQFSTYDFVPCFEIINPNGKKISPTPKYNPDWEQYILDFATARGYLDRRNVVKSTDGTKAAPQPPTAE